MKQFILKSKFYSLAIICLIVNIDYLYAEEVREKKLTVKQMHADVNYFYKKVLEIHPNPYQMLTPEELYCKKEEIIKEITAPLTKREFWLKVAQLNTYFDAHTAVLQIKELYNQALKGVCLPGASFYLLDNELFFSKNDLLWDANMQGKRIVKINNIEINQLIKTTKQFFSYEGQSGIIGDLFTAKMFICLYNLFPLSDTLQIEYISENTVEKIMFPKHEMKVYMKNKLALIADKKENTAFRVYPKDSIAIFEFNTCFGNKLEKEKGDFNLYLTGVFDTLRILGIKHFFIDVSINQGGNSTYVYQVLDFLNVDLNRLYPIEYSCFRISSEMKKFRSNSKSLLSYKFKQLFSKPLGKMGSRKNGTYYPVNPSWEFQDSTKKRYTQNLYIIQGTNSASATLDLLSFVKAYKLGYIIGDETMYYSSGYTDIVPLEMKNSKIPFFCATKYFKLVCYEEERKGIAPDFYYEIKNPYKKFLLEELKHFVNRIDN